MTEVIEQIKVKEIKQGKEKRNVPRLRFRGFEDEWIEKRISDFLDFYTTNSLSRENLTYEKGEIKNIHYGDIHMKFPVMLDVEKNSIPFINDLVDASKFKCESFCRKGDIIIADASENYEDIGKVVEIVNMGNSKVVAGLHTILGRDNTGTTSVGFKGYIFQSNNVRKQIKVLAAGAKVLGISKSNLSSIRVNIPILQEQKKIAHFFALIDKKIEKQSEKVEALKTYKKGIMQKIFKQEIRFKDENGREYPEWEEKRLGDIIELKSVRNSNNNVNFILSVSNSKGFICQDEQFEDRIVASSNVSNYKVVNKDDFAFNPSRINVGSIARLKYFEQGIVSPMYICFRCKSRLKNDFLEFFLDTYHFNAQVKNKLEGSVRQSLSSDSLCSIKINLPCLKEQVKIANFLTIINKKIEKEEKKLEKLKVYKKGLLQKMFV